MTFLVLLLALLAVAAVLSWTPDLDRATLEARYLRSPTDLVEVAGTTLDVRDDGPSDAPAIVLVHGFGSSLLTWDAWLPGLAVDHRVVRFDLPGSGLSPPDATGAYDDARSMALVAALLDARGIARATLVGNSIGGRIAWNFAAAHPDRVDRLVLVSPDGFAAPGLAYGEVPKAGVVAEAMRFVLPRFVVRKALAPAFADPAALTEPLFERYYDELRAPGARAAMIERWRQSLRTDPHARLASIRAPTLVLWGEGDHVIPFANAAAYVAAIPHATLAPLPGVGHLPQEEAPERSLAIVRAFIGGRPFPDDAATR